MRNVIGIAITTACFGLLTLSSCGGEEPTTPTADCFKTKKDSLDFVAAVIKKYPEAQGPKIGDFGYNKLKYAAPPPPTQPIDWAQVEEYARNYDLNPLLQNKKGFMINANGLNMLKGNANYKQVYLRLGKYTNTGSGVGDYTVMLIPLNATGTVLHRGVGNGTVGGLSNYDFLDPCPVVCPEDFDN